MTTTALEHLAGTYFHQDWHDSYGSVAGTVAAFVAGSPSDAPLLPAEIQRVLTTHPTEESLEEYLDSLGCEYYAQPSDGGYRSWLTYLAEVAQREMANPNHAHHPGAPTKPMTQVAARPAPGPSRVRR